jgi:hypothetical protein
MPGYAVLTARRPLQKPFSYVVGWLCCLGWISGIPACGLQLAGNVQAMVQLTHSPTDYSLAWQAALTIFLFILLTVAFNIYFAQHAPLAEGIVLFIHEIPANAVSSNTLLRRIAAPRLTNAAVGRLSRSRPRTVCHQFRPEHGPPSHPLGVQRSPDLLLHCVHR